MSKGYINSIQSLGAVDGPGIRFVVFMQGCPLRCGCCHNPDTWEPGQGKEYTPDEIIKKALRYREYFGRDGGITVSGGEPLLQSEFVAEVFRLAHAEGINTCLDTSGCILNDEVEALIAETDRVLLDIKYTNDEDYQKYVGCRIEPVLDFLGYLNDKNIPTTVRQVIIPGINDNADNIRNMKKICDEHSCIDKVELLPFKKLCKTKYENLGIEFPFGNINEPDAAKMQELEQILQG